VTKDLGEEIVEFENMKIKVFKLSIFNKKRKFAAKKWYRKVI